MTTTAPPPFLDGDPGPGTPMQVSTHIAGSITPSLSPTAPARIAETSAAAVAAREKAAIEARHLVAISRPRNIEQVRADLLAACSRPLFCEEAKYSKPVGGDKPIVGPSIRFAEEGARAWGNLDTRATVVFDDEIRRTYRVDVSDLERNISYAVDVELEKTVERRAPRAGDRVLRSRKTSQGSTVYIVIADEEAFRVKQNANLSIAIRNGILRVLPSWLVEEAMEKVDATLEAEAKKSPEARQKRMLNAFAQLKVSAKEIEAWLGHKIEAVTGEEVTELLQCWTAMRDGETTWAEILALKTGKPAESGAPASTAAGTGGLKARMGATPPVAGETTMTEGAPTASAAEDLALDQQLAAE